VGGERERGEVIVRKIEEFERGESPDGCGENLDCVVGEIEPQEAHEISNLCEKEERGKGGQGKEVSKVV
jgi:hypothetical protein